MHPLNSHFERNKFIGGRSCSNPRAASAPEPRVGALAQAETYSISAREYPMASVGESRTPGQTTQANPVALPVESLCGPQRQKQSTTGGRHGGTTCASRYRVSPQLSYNVPGGQQSPKTKWARGRSRTSRRNGRRPRARRKHRRCAGPQDLPGNTLGAVSSAQAARTTHLKHGIENREAWRETRSSSAEEVALDADRYAEAPRLKPLDDLFRHLHAAE